jgi:hypothetical protein
MSKHTPGPWIASKYADSGRDILITGGPNSDAVATARYFFSLSGPIVSRDPEREANAQLIAAAPELLEALEQTLVIAIEGRRVVSSGPIRRYHRTYYARTIWILEHGSGHDYFAWSLDPTKRPPIEEFSRLSINECRREIRATLPEHKLYPQKGDKLNAFLRGL